MAPVQVFESVSVVAGDVVRYQVPGREVKGWACPTSQFVLEVNEAGDVLTAKDGWRPAGSFTWHRPVPAMQRTPTSQDCAIFAQGRSWFILGKALPKERYVLTERQQRNGAMRAKREVERAAKAHKKALQRTPPLFYEQPQGPLPRYSTAEQANAHLRLIRDDFTENRRECRARTIRGIRARLASYSPQEVARLHALWQGQGWASGIEYLAGFLHTQECLQQQAKKAI
ncbi:hypothetical protein [Hymenobacter sp. DG01]|uniref:hypothetical protein n=1 Tax=Hymenobacter sp. DG01 TaxID=2584940 RepID=UPI001120C65C|nr:hypothetical protein [Hymenobacter sp. DG01]